MGNWDNTTRTESKFFDKHQDKEYQRRQEREHGVTGKGYNKKSVKFATNGDLNQAS